MKKYVKPQLVAKNNPTGSFAAGCPTNRPTGGAGSKMRCNSSCEIRN